MKIIGESISKSGKCNAGEMARGLHGKWYLIWHWGLIMMQPFLGLSGNIVNIRPLRRWCGHFWVARHRGPRRFPSLGV